MCLDIGLNNLEMHCCFVLFYSFLLRLCKGYDGWHFENRTTHQNHGFKRECMYALYLACSVFSFFWFVFFNFNIFYRVYFVISLSNMYMRIWHKCGVSNLNTDGFVRIAQSIGFLCKAWMCRTIATGKLFTCGEITSWVAVSVLPFYLIHILGSLNLW